MMTLQAREMLSPHTAPTHALRAYPTDSPRAKARLIALALLADGRLDISELEALGRHGMFSALGIDREDFFQVLFDFCSDIVRLPIGAGDYVLPPETVTGLFSEIRNRQDRRILLEMIAAVIGSDGVLADGEEKLFREAVRHWRVGLGDHAGKTERSGHGRGRMRGRSELYYG